MGTCSTDIFQLASLHVLLWHELGLALSHWAFKGTSVFADRLHVTRLNWHTFLYSSCAPGSSSLVDTSEKRLSCHSVTH
jgi:hypothetical protein